MRALVRRFHRGTKVIGARVEAFNAFNTTNFDDDAGALLSPLFAQPVDPKQRVELAADRAVVRAIDEAR